MVCLVRSRCHWVPGLTELQLRCSASLCLQQLFRMNWWCLRLDQLLESLGRCFPAGNSQNTLRSRPRQRLNCSDYYHISMQNIANFLVYFCRCLLLPHLTLQNSRRVRRGLAVLILLWSWSSHLMQAGQPPTCGQLYPPDKGTSYLCLTSHHVISQSSAGTHLHLCG